MGPNSRHIQLEWSPRTGIPSTSAPIVSEAEVQEHTGTTFTAANNLVARLAKPGILQEATGYKRNRVFRHAPLHRHLWRQLAGWF